MCGNIRWLLVELNGNLESHYYDGKGINTDFPKLDWQKQWSMEIQVLKGIKWGCPRRKWVILVGNRLEMHNVFKDRSCLKIKKT